MAGKGAAPGERRGGRAAGTPNKASSLAKEAFAAFVDGNSHKLMEWLEQIDNPKDRFNCFMSVAEYHLPKLSRAEVKADVTLQQHEEWLEQLK